MTQEQINQEDTHIRIDDQWFARQKFLFKGGAITEAEYNSRVETMKELAYRSCGQRLNQLDVC